MKQSRELILMLNAILSKEVFVWALSFTTVIHEFIRAELTSYKVFVNTTYSQVKMSEDAAIMFALASLPGVTDSCR